MQVGKDKKKVEMLVKKIPQKRARQLFLLSGATVLSLSYPYTRQNMATFCQFSKVFFPATDAQACMPE